MSARRIPALLRRGGRSPVVGGGSGPPAPAQVWDDLTALAGWTFSRASAATDGAPATGLPVGDVDDYLTDVVREVSAKLGLTAQPAYLLEGARTNSIPDSDNLGAASWTNNGSVTTTTGQPDPSGGTAGARLVCASGVNLRRWLSGSTTGTQNIAGSAWVRESSSPGGSYQIVAGKNTAGSFAAVGGTASSTWVRARAFSAATAISAPFLHVVDGSDRSAVGGLTAGARDAIVAFPQLEIGQLWPSSYIRTSGGAATRAADNARLTLPAAWCANVLTVEVRPEYSSAQFLSSATTRRMIDDGTHRLSLVVDAGACKVQLVTTAGTYLSPALSFSAGDVLRVEVDWPGLSLDVSVNGTPVASTVIAGSWASGGTAYIARNVGGTETISGVISIGGIR